MAEFVSFFVGDLGLFLSLNTRLPIANNIIPAKIIPARRFEIDGDEDVSFSLTGVGL